MNKILQNLKDAIRHKVIADNHESTCQMAAKEFALSLFGYKIGDHVQGIRIDDVIVKISGEHVIAIFSGRKLTKKGQIAKIGRGRFQREIVA